MPFSGVEYGDADTLRGIEGEICDLCGDECYPASEICVACNCHACDTSLYHQACVEKYLKKIGLQANRKCGFVCPRGRGKGTKVAKECKGKIEKSHPIIPRNEEKKKARTAPIVLEPAPKHARGKAAAGGAAAVHNSKAAAQANKPPPGPKLAASRKQQSYSQVKPYHHTLSAPRPVPSPSPPPPGDDDAEASSSAAAGADGPRPAALPVGLVLEEALTKAQKKNLARKKKRAVNAADETLSVLSEADSTTTTTTTTAAAAAASSARGSLSGDGDAAALAACGGLSAVQYAQLSGFDGLPLQFAAGGAGGPAANGSDGKYVTSLDAYNQLVAGALSSDDEDAYEVEDDDDDDEEEGQDGSSVSTGTPTAAFAAPVAVPVAAAPASAAGNGGEDDLEAAIQASMAQYLLEQQMDAQRAVLAAGGGLSALLGARRGPAAAAPLVPIAVPVVPSAAAPALPLFPGSGATAASKHAPDAAATDGGWVLGVGADARCLVGSGAAGGAMAAPGKAAAAPATAAPAGDDDDDDLGALLALCGVAG